MTTSKNWPLLIETLDFIVKNQDKWDQRKYISACGTYACVAGWAAQFAGYAPMEIPAFHYDWVRHQEVFSGTGYYSDTLLNPGVEQPDLSEFEIDGGQVPWRKLYNLLDNSGQITETHQAAATSLGLSADEAMNLFDGGNNLYDILRLVANWADADKIDLPEHLREEGCEPLSYPGDERCEDVAR